METDQNIPSNNRIILDCYSVPHKKAITIRSFENTPDFIDSMI